MTNLKSLQITTKVHLNGGYDTIIAKITARKFQQQEITLVRGCVMWLFIFRLYFVYIFLIDYVVMLGYNVIRN